MLNMLYEGKAKKIYQATNDNQVIVYYKDDATAFNGVKKQVIFNKGVINNKISEVVFTQLKSHGINNHFLRRIDDRNQLCSKVKIIPLEIIIRNVVAGSIVKRLGIEEGLKLNRSILEICYKNDVLEDPLLNDDHVLALSLISLEELNKIKIVAHKINQILTTLFEKINFILVDFKIEFGKTDDNQIILADEISPDTMRLWDKNSLEKFDKDRFRRDLGNIEQFYSEVLNRLLKK